MDKLLSFSWISGSTDDALMEACCLKIAQHIGVAKVKMTPKRPIWSGAPNHGILLKVPFCSSLFITRGIRIIPSQLTHHGLFNGGVASVLPNLFVYYWSTDLTL